jgi:hypothetical protein
MVTHARDQVSEGRVTRVPNTAGEVGRARAVPGGDIIPLHVGIIERFGSEPEQGLIFLQERLHGAVGIIRVEHLRRVIGQPPGLLLTGQRRFQRLRGLSSWKSRG